jgi:hypothetical protein
MLKDKPTIVKFNRKNEVERGMYLVACKTTVKIAEGSVYRGFVQELITSVNRKLVDITLAYFFVILS